ncbi:hypothetical protein REPUB_Repub03eG0158400 [Reevesia pubescens]
MRKERFLAQKRSKLLLRGDGHFQVLEKIKDNAYKLDLPSEYNFSATFNVSDISLYDVGDDSRTNPFEERRDDENQDPHVLDWKHSTKSGQVAANNPLCVPSGPITRSIFKKIKEAM